MDTKFLQRVQAAGWIIRHADMSGGVVYVSPPGYDLVVKLSAGAKIPVISDLPASPARLETFDDLRQIWRQRRQELGLTHEDVEHIVGCTPSHYAKVERDTWNSADVKTRRMPNAQFAMDISAGLGLPLFVDRGQLPPVTLRAMANSAGRRRISALLALGGRMVPSKQG